MNKIPHICTIKQLATETGISEYCIRQWVKQGAFKVLRSGKKYLINYDVFIKFLVSGEENQPTSAPPTYYGIRRVVG